jgi:PEP-CTERM motif-containing protein
VDRNYEVDLVADPGLEFTTVWRYFSGNTDGAVSQGIVSGSETATINGNSIGPCIYNYTGPSGPCSQSMTQGFFINGANFLAPGFVWLSSNVYPDTTGSENPIPIFGPDLTLDVQLHTFAAGTSINQFAVRSFGLALNGLQAAPIQTAPVPEPGSLSLLGAALLLGFGMARSRKV